MQCSRFHGVILGLVLLSFHGGLPAGVGTANLRALTKQGAPLMRPIEWRIYRVRDNKRELMSQFKRHSGPIRLCQGSYVATLWFQSREYETFFKVQSDYIVDVPIKTDFDYLE